MPELRKDPISDRWIIISTERGRRPSDFGTPSVAEEAGGNKFCPFDEGNEAKTPAEIVDDVIKSTPDLTTLNLGDKEFILAAGSKENADKLWAVLKDQVTPVPGKVIEASTTVIKVAVTDDAKAANTADFIVNLKKPLEDKDVPAVGFEYKIPPATALVGTYDSYAQIPATATLAQTAQIVLRDGEIQVEKKKVVPVHKPAAGHKPAAH